MAHNCENCKYSDIDYIFDEELGEEYPIYSCEKGNDVSIDFECKDFEEYKSEPYVEKFTECDKCGYLLKCKSEGEVTSCTSVMDNYEHFTKRAGTYCRKESGDFADKKLSEIVEMAKKSNDSQLKSNGEFLQKAIERFGDITYKEFIKDKLYKIYHL